MNDAEDLPRYTEEGPDFSTSIQDLLLSLGDYEVPIHEYPSLSEWRASQGTDRATVEMYQRIVTTYFRSIQTKNKEAVAAMIQNDIVTPNTTNSLQQTPLLAAIDNEDIRMVQCLVDFGADIDGFGCWFGAQRTPLQLAASKGNLALVRLFVEVFHADDAKLAPDGELALRLAAQNGHYDVVNYLPARRKGGWLRWKTHHEKSIRRIKRAYQAITQHGRLVLWDIPRMLLWELPKHAIVIPVWKKIKWCWSKRHDVADWCVYQIRELPRRIKRAGIAVGNKVKQIPAAAARLSKAAWKFLTVKLPRMIRKTLRFVYILIKERIPAFTKATAKWIWNFLTLLFTKWIPTLIKRLWRSLVVLITKRIPQTISFLSKLLWNGVKDLGEALFNIVQRTVSFFHTVLIATITLLRSLTLQDIWNAFYSVLHSIFVVVPTAIWSFVSKIPEAIHRTMQSIFGVVGVAVFWIGWAVVTIVTYVPMQLFEMLSSLGSSALKGCNELLVWINPKR